jgi:hypothetical protein
MIGKVINVLLIWRKVQLSFMFYRFQTFLAWGLPTVTEVYVGSLQLFQANTERLRKPYSLPFRFIKNLSAI